MATKDNSDGYCDDYPSCKRTYATLRLIHPDLDPDTVSREMTIEPSDTQRAGEPRDSGTRRPYKNSAWYLRSEGVVESRDLRRHLDWLLDRLESKSALLAGYAARGWLVDIIGVWDSAQGHGGPTLSPKQLKRLGDLGVEIWFDVYAPRGLLEDSLT